MSRLVALAASFAALGAAFVTAASSHDPKQREDLAAVIALQGKPCGSVVSYATQGENDFVATCKDGNRYRVYTKDGRVLVEKQK
ncbi:hypothetical protein [Usitatibacter palustris]|uniref:Peptidase propeptide and YPEB domain-containing protein n=1 Tax=Usitatibacter palustris TaxID=2732487 RepID=A0A6M4H8E5_9PROT|nr:hypothetical protein [Usitatibacter palustris]QJR15886.1 hypothetical protein DSM104440_02712 [Usitatibacter palustris]